MDGILEKLNKLNTMIDLLDDHEKLHFENKIIEQTNKIDSIINEMNDNICTLQFSKEKCHQKELEMRKEEIVINNLFPVYLRMNEYVNSMN